jgi:hypothetical protein
MNENVKAKLAQAKAKVKRHAPVVLAASAVIAIGAVAYIKNKNTESHEDPRHTYSYGPESILKIEATDAEASAFNRVTKAFYEAQQRMTDAGAPWNPRNPLLMDVDRSDMKIYNKLADRFNAALALINQDETPIVIDDDYLTKN